MLNYDNCILKKCIYCIQVIKHFYVHTAGGLIINFNKTNPWGIIYETSIFHLNQKFIKNAFLQP